jgi:hypothetical protein
MQLAFIALHIRQELAKIYRFIFVYRFYLS